MNHQELLAWREVFNAQPNVYYVEEFYDHTWQPTGNFYLTESAAQFEVDFLAKYKRKVRIASNPIHSEALSRQRWPS